MRLVARTLNVGRGERIFRLIIGVELGWEEVKNSVVLMNEKRNCIYALPIISAGFLWHKPTLLVGYFLPCS